MSTTLNDDQFITLAACSMLRVESMGATAVPPTDAEIRMAITAVQVVWKEVGRQRRLDQQQAIKEWRLSHDL
jgi:hypothetical protein